MSGYHTRSQSGRAGGGRAAAGAGPVPPPGIKATAEGMPEIDVAEELRKVNADLEGVRASITKLEGKIEQLEEQYPDILSRPQEIKNEITANKELLKSRSDAQTALLAQKTRLLDGVAVTGNVLLDEKIKVIFTSRWGESLYDTKK